MNSAEVIQRHVKTHTERSAEDRSAVSVLESFLRSDGRINPHFSSTDSWPNTDGTFEFVENPNISRRPSQNLFVQIKGTTCYSEVDGKIKYCLKSLAFPAFAYQPVTFDPCILFVVLHPDNRGMERVFWKYMSVSFLNDIDFGKESVTISFSSEEEIKNTDESVERFCEELIDIIDRHAFIRELNNSSYSKKDAVEIIKSCNQQITESIDRMDICNDTRDNISRRILTRLKDLCKATLILNALSHNQDKVSLSLAWEQSLLDIRTKYLGAFLKSLKYIGGRIPDEGQAERLMLKYYEFLWQIRDFLKKKYGISVLHNLERFPRNQEDPADEEYYKAVAQIIENTPCYVEKASHDRYYIQKKASFFVGTERYYEITLQLAGIYATKYNRITVYTKENISTNYSIEISYQEVPIKLWDVPSEIKIISGWKVSIEPTCLNKLTKILFCFSAKLSSNYGEYAALMNFLTATGIDLLSLIDLRELQFHDIVNQIYQNCNTACFKDVLLYLRKNFTEGSKSVGYNTIRYLLIELKEETLENVMVSQFAPKCLCDQFLLSTKCIPFERNPFISNLPGSRTNEIGNLKNILKAAGDSKLDEMSPFIKLKSLIRQNCEIYFDEAIFSEGSIDKFNESLSDWELKNGYKIKRENGFVCIDFYEEDTLFIIKKLLELSSIGNKGQEAFNRQFVKRQENNITDPLKKQALTTAFVNSRILLIYGAAGTGKTTLINYLSNMMNDRSKLFLTKTHTALQNLKARIDNPGTEHDFISIDSFTRKVNLKDYDVIFVDECSTIDNRTMRRLLSKINEDSFLVLAGDTYQIESIDFGNWFSYAKELVKAPGVNVELLTTWRTEKQELINLWDEVRNKGMITEKLVFEGPFSEKIGENIFHREEEDEVILCLNYDGKFGLNNINKYFQSLNKQSEAFEWQEWKYKIGDPILFSNAPRFPMFYNNLKGRIADIKKDNHSITFTVDIGTILTESHFSGTDVEYIDTFGEETRVRFTVYQYDPKAPAEKQDEMRLRTVIPFHLAYAVSIHKAQGLEFNSVKILIPSANAEKITHGIFYTAITRAKEKLKIFWFDETMQQVIRGFYETNQDRKSLDIVKSKIKQTS